MSTFWYGVVAGTNVAKLLDDIWHGRKWWALADVVIAFLMWCGAKLEEA